MTKTYNPEGRIEYKVLKNASKKRTIEYGKNIQSRDPYSHSNVPLLFGFFRACVLFGAFIRFCFSNSCELSSFAGTFG
jgi:hypothetical protein